MWKILLFALTLKGPGFFVYLTAGGGGVDSAPPPPPPSDLGRGATKNSEIWQGFSNFFSEGLDHLDETPVQPERARTVFGGGGGGGQNMCAKRTSRARSAKSLVAGVQGPLKALEALGL